MAYFHSLAKEYGWTFTEIELETGTKLLVPMAERAMFIRGVFAGEARYHRKKTE